MKYRIEWTNLISNTSSHGKWFDTKELLESSVEYLNKKYKYEIIHKVVSQ